ncbi:MAG: hypothetical protein HY820_23670 [Acidobacteria bacterium]|nr:hypothetical protein [Acidobacteriota bacterium]
MTRRLLVAVYLVCSVDGANLDFEKAFSGNGRTNITATASDRDGNVYVTGSTTSFDLAVKNAAQPRNPGSAVIVSRDGGQTWLPTGHIPEVDVIAPVKLPLTQPVLLTLGVNGIYRSVDDGNAWETVFDVARNRGRVGYVDSIAFDPRNPSVVYVSASGGVLKSTDGGRNWTLLTAGLTAGGCCQGSRIAVDPFRAGRLYYSLGSRAYVSADSGATWRALTVPAGLRNPRVIANPWSADGLFVYSYEAVYRSLDAGATWQWLPVPSASDISEWIPHPARNGRIYSRTWAGVLRSDDGGQSWVTLPVPRVDGVSGGRLSIHPGNADALFVEGRLSSSDGGRTWQASRLQRSVGFTFDLSDPNRVYAGGWVTSDAFVAKVRPSGEIEYLSYLGGQGHEGANSIAVDGSGAVYLAGRSESPDFPGVRVRSYSGARPSSFVAKLDSSGSLVYSALVAEDLYHVGADGSGSLYTAGWAGITKVTANGTGIEYSTALAQVTAMAVDSAGNVVVNAGDRLVKVGAGGGVVFEKQLGLVGPVAVNEAGEILMAAAASGSPPVSADAYQKRIDTACPHSSGEFGLRGNQRAAYMTDVYVMKFSPEGEGPLIATLVGGNCRDAPTSISAGADGSIWIGGTTYSDPFPVADPMAGPPRWETEKPFVAHLDSKGEQLLYSSYVETGDWPVVATGPDGGVYVSGNSALNKYGYSGPALLWKISPARNPLAITRAANAFNRFSGGISPGEIVQLDVPGLDPEEEMELRLDSAAPMEFGGVVVTFRGIPAQLVSVKKGVVLCVSPAELLAGEAAAVRVRQNGARSADFYVHVRKRNLTFFPQVRNEDGTVNSAENVARPGSSVTMFVTGAGSPPLETANLLRDGYAMLGTVRITPLEGFVAGLYEFRWNVAQTPGAYQINIADPNPAPTEPVVSPGITVMVR